MKKLDNTQYFKIQSDQELKVGEILQLVYQAMTEKGYDPVNQIVGYIMSETQLTLPVIREPEA